MELDQFLAELASDSPVPGGGSVAALSSALGASLVGMVAALTIGRKRYADVEPQAEEIRGIARQLSDRSRALIDEDAASFRAVGAAMALPRESDAESTERTARLQDALKGATVPPLETMAMARDVVILSQRILTIGNRSALSDVAVAALMAGAAFDAARLNVEINLAAIRDEQWVTKRRREMDALGDVGPAVRAVTAEVENRIRGSKA